MSINYFQINRLVQHEDIGKKNSKVISIFQPFLSPIEQIIAEGLYVP